MLKILGVSEYVVTLNIPRDLALPEEIIRLYPHRTLFYKVQDRENFLADHQPLLRAIRESAEGRLLCGCQSGRFAPVGVRRSPTGDGSYQVYRLHHEGLRHQAGCPFWSAPTVSHTESSVRDNEDGTISVKLNFGLGVGGSNGFGDADQDESPLRTRRVVEKLDGYGPEAFLR